MPCDENYWDAATHDGVFLKLGCPLQDPKFEYCRVSMGDNATETLQSRFEALVECWQEQAA